MNRRYLFAAFVLAAGLLYVLAAAPRATATDPAGGDSADRPRVGLHGWRVDLSRYEPGREAQVSGWAGMIARLGDKAPDGSSVARLRSEQHFRGQARIDELAVTFHNDCFPVSVDVDYRGFDMLMNPVAVSGSLTLRDGALHALVGETPEMILLVQLSTLDE